ncbi:MAG: hypothetical protein ACREV3_05135 [Gammaproteobacteria bacterium]
MSIPRHVQPELLDALPANDPRAIRARGDLQRVNRVMGALSLVLRALDRSVMAQPPRSIVELGSGDGTFLLRLARKRAACWPGVKITLLDRQLLVSPKTVQGFVSLGWKTEVITSDVFDWLAQPVNERIDLLLANLFIHHFSEERLCRLLQGIEARTGSFLACEPRRASLALIGSHLLGLIGCNAVTRHDAVLSVHAGFRAEELSALWPRREDWILREWRAGLFSHCFLAAKAAR